MTKPTVANTLNEAKEYLKNNFNNLHLVLNNKNIKDRDVKFCLEQAKSRDDLLGIRLCETMLKMSKTQRLKLVSSL